MREAIKILVTCIAAVFVTSEALSQDFESNGICYNVTGGDEVAVVERIGQDGVNEYSGVIIVPESVFFDGFNYRVTKVDEYAFSGSGVTAVVLPNSITRLGESAFADATELRQVTLPLGLREIPKYCFAGTSLSDIALPEGVERIGYGAFQECTMLHTMFLPSTLRSIEAYALDWCFNLYEIYCSALLPPRVGHDAFDWLPRVDLIVNDDAVADRYSVASEWGDNDRFTIFQDEVPEIINAGEKVAFCQNWLRVAMPAHLAYNVYDDLGELIAYTSGEEIYLPAKGRDIVYRIIPTTVIGEGEEIEVEVAATSGIERIDDEPFSPVPEPVITARDGQIHIWTDTYRRAVRVWDIYGNLYFERFTNGNEAVELPGHRVYIVTVDDYVKKVLL